MLRRFLFLVLGAALGCGCSGGGMRSSSVLVGDAPLDSLGAVVLLPCGAHVALQEDPDGIAPGMATSRWQTAVVARQLPQARRVSRPELRDMNLTAQVDAFYGDWLTHPQQGDGKALQRVILRLQPQTLLVAGVHVWEQDDERTRVGMLAGLFDATSGDMLWWSEQVREMHRDDPEASPPDYVVVMDSVVDALIEALSRALTPRDTP